MNSEANAGIVADGSLLQDVIPRTRKIPVQNVVLPPYYLTAARDFTLSWDEIWLT